MSGQDGSETGSESGSSDGDVGHHVPGARDRTMVIPQKSENKVSDMALPSLRIRSGTCNSCQSETSCVYNPRGRPGREWTCGFCDPLVYEQVSDMEKERWLNG